MEIAETDAINEVRHSRQRLPFIAATVSLLIIAGGAIFAQTSNEAPAQAEEISATQSPATTSDPVTTNSPVALTMSPGAVPVIPNVAPSAGKYSDDEREGDESYGHNGDDD